MPGTGTALPGFNAADVCNAKLPADRQQRGPAAGKIERRHAGRTVFEPSKHRDGGDRLLAHQHEDMLANLPESGLLPPTTRKYAEPVRA
jgi:iron complex outermembrane receptor protein